MRLVKREIEHSCDIWAMEMEDWVKFYNVYDPLLEDVFYDNIDVYIAVQHYNLLESRRRLPPENTTVNNRY